MRYAPFALALVITIINQAAPSAASAACQPVHLDVRLHDRRAMLDIAIDDRPAHMVLDTGASQILLMADTPDRLGLVAAADHPPEQRRSYGQVFQVHFVRARHIAFAGLSREVTDLAVAGSIEAGIDGLFTDDRLQQADFDLAQGRVDLVCDGTPEWARAANVVSLPLEDGSRPFSQAVINGQVLRVLFDTGSPVSSMTLQAAKRSGVPVGKAPDEDAAGLGGSPLHAWAGRIAEMRLGGQVVHDVPIQVVDKPNASADMIAGFDVFLRHRIWIDRKGGRLVIQMSNGAF